MDFDFMDNISFANEFWILLLPCILMGIDFVTGFINAWSSHSIKSYVMRTGLAKKGGEFVILVIGELFTYAFKLPPYIMSFLSIYIVIMELISILENLDKLGVPIPKFISRVLRSTEDKIQNGTIEDLKDLGEQDAIDDREPEPDPGDTHE